MRIDRERDTDFGDLTLREGNDPVVVQAQDLFGRHAVLLLLPANA